MMKSAIIKNTVKLFFSIMIILSFSGCKQKLFKKINYSGVAYDHINGQPMAGAKIELKACGGGPGDKAIYGCDGNQFSIGTTTTDENGHFSITGKAARSNIYYVYIGNHGAFSDGVSEAELKSAYLKIYYYP